LFVGALVFDRDGESIVLPTHFAHFC
jgi:hypothetical protein